MPPSRSSSRPTSRPTSRPPSRRPSFSHLTLQPLSTTSAAPSPLPTSTSMPGTYFPHTTTPTTPKHRRSFSSGLHFTPDVYERDGPRPRTSDGRGRRGSVGASAASSGATTPRRSYIASFSASPERGGHGHGHGLGFSAAGVGDAGFGGYAGLGEEWDGEDGEEEEEREEWGEWLGRVFAWDEREEDEVEGESREKKEEEWGLWEEAVWLAGWAVVGMGYLY